VRTASRDSVAADRRCDYTVLVDNTPNAVRYPTYRSRKPNPIIWPTVPKCHGPIVTG
jgi:hypothetical protein